jgi:excinuclease UvrABC nuclease subunit
VNGPPEAHKTTAASEFWAVRDKELLKKEMKIAARNLDFERAAEIRDLLKKIKT